MPLSLPTFLADLVTVWHLSRMHIRGILAAIVLFTLAAPATAQGFAPGMHVYSLPTGLEWGVEPTVSEDGTAIGVGYFSPTSGGSNWGVTITPSAVTQFPEQSRVYDIADGGAYTVGFASRRSAAGVTDVIIPGATRPSGSEVRTSISGDGSVVAGTLEDSSFSFQAAYRWTEQSGLQYLGGYRPGAAYTRVYAVSRDGGTIVGQGSVSLFSDGEAWRWTAASGYSILPDLADSRPGFARAMAVSADGSIIAGRTGDPTFGTRGIVWRDNQILALPTIPGWRSAEATDLCDDGSIIVGSLSSSLVGLPETAAIWTQETNWVPALDYFRMHGVDIPSYYSPQFSRFTVSADGRTFSSLLTDTRTNEQILAVVVIPSPAVAPLLGMACIFSRRARPHRAAIAR